MASRNWFFSDQTEDPINGGINSFQVQDGCEGGPKLTEENIWQIYDLLMSMGFLNAGATIQGDIPPSSYVVERPVEEV